MNLLLLCLLFVASVSAETETEDILANMYDDLDPAPCFRFFQRSGEPVGCSSSKNGDIGVIVKGLAFPPGTEKVALVLDAFNASVAEQIEASGDVERVASVLVLSGSPLKSYSPSARTRWNSGDGLSTMFIPYFVAQLDRNESARMFQKAEENEKANYRGARHVVSTAFYMGKNDMTTDECLNFEDFYGKASRKCLLIGGQSVWGTFGGLPGNGSEPLVLVTAAMDGRAFFEDYSYAANGAASGIIALLAAASALGEIRNDVGGLNRQIAFAFFQGETFGNLGSVKFLKDSIQGCVKTSENFKCSDPPSYDLYFAKLQPGNISHMISVDQVGRGANLFVHGDGMENAFGTQVRRANTPDLPPSAAAIYKASSSFGGEAVVLAGYDREYEEVSPHYGSQFDDVVSSDSITNASEILLKALLKIASGPTAPPEVSIDRDLVEQLVETFTVDFASDIVSRNTNYSIGVLRSLVRPIAKRSQTSSKLPLYPGTFRRHYNGGATMSLLELFIRNFLANATSRVAIPAPPKLVDPSFSGPYDFESCSIDSQCEKNCTSGMDNKSALGCVAGRCVCLSTFYHDSYGEFSEPFWSAPDVHTYVEQHRLTTICFLVFGLFLTAVSVWFSKNNNVIINK